MIVPVAKTGVNVERELADFNLFLHREETPAKVKPVTAKQSPPDAGTDPDLWIDTEPGALNLKPRYGTGDHRDLYRRGQTMF
jgi:hypothetical protein